MSQIMFLIATLLLSGCQTETATSPVYNSTEKLVQSQLEEYFSALLALKQFNGVVLVETQGKVLFKKTFNLENDPTNSLHVTESHQFDLRSISKLVAKYAVYQLEKEGKIAPNDLIHKYLPDFPNGDKITINHLMYNQSGLSRDFSDDSLELIKMDTPEIVELIKKETLEFEPGTETRYSNLGYQLLYSIIGKISNKPFAQYVQDEIYAKAKMHSSGAHFYTNENRLNKHATYHTTDDGEIIHIDHFEKGSKKQAKLFSTADDLIKLLHSLQQTPYGNKLAGKSGIIAHSGGSEGIRTHIQTIKTNDYAFVFLANYDAIPFNDIVETVEKIIAGETIVIPSKPDRKAVTLSEDQLKKYVGKYDFKDAGHIIMDVRLEEGKLVVYQEGEFAGNLFAETESVFFGDPHSTESFEFLPDTNGNYKAIMDFKGAPWEGTKME